MSDGQDMAAQGMPAEQNTGQWINSIHDMADFETEMARFERQRDVNAPVVDPTYPVTPEQLQDHARQIHEALMDFNNFVDNPTGYQVRRLRALNDGQRNLLWWKILVWTQATFYLSHLKHALGSY